MRSNAQNPYQHWILRVNYAFCTERKTILTLTFLHYFLHFPFYSPLDPTLTLLGLRTPKAPFGPPTAPSRGV